MVPANHFALEVDIVQGQTPLNYLRKRMKESTSSLRYDSTAKERFRLVHTRSADSSKVFPILHFVVEVPLLSLVFLVFG